MVAAGKDESKSNGGKQHYHLMLAFFRVGMLGYGGGPSSIPLVHKEVVHKYKWMSDDEFADILAIANTLPGPIATKMAGYIGFRISGLMGSILSVLATIVPTIFLMIILLTFLTSFKDQPWVAGMTHAVVPVVGVMLATLTWDFLKKAHKGLGWLKTTLLVAASLIIMEGLGIHPAFIIAAVLIYVLIKPQRKASDQSKSKDGREVG